ncbi:MAG: hypothetical protein AMXMBFR84_01150 [Candidatus Hydrogenedentota bacterium]
MRKRRLTHSLLVPAVFLSVAHCACGLELLWKTDLVSSSRGLPLAADFDGDGLPEIIATTRFDGAVWVLDNVGREIHKFTRDAWLEGGLASSTSSPGRPRMLAYQQSDGRVVLFNASTGLSVYADVPGNPAIGCAPVFANLNGKGAEEILITRKDGVLSAFNNALEPIWLYSAGSPIESAPSVALLYTEFASVYVLTADGVLHAVRGDGMPMWRVALANAAPRFPSVTDVTVVEIGRDEPAVLVSDAAGILYAFGAATGREFWRVQAAASPMGAPAYITISGHQDNAFVLMSESGELAVVDRDGTLTATGTLPKGRYIARPLVADVDEDGELEIVAATNNWQIVVANRTGEVEEWIDLRGSAREGLIMADVNDDGRLELLAATDCAAVYCFATRARSGWAHPRCGAANTGVASVITPRPVPTDAIAVSSLRYTPKVTVAPHTTGSTYTTAVLEFQRGHGDRHVVATIRQEGRIVGSTAKSPESGELAVTVARRFPVELTCDVIVYGSSGRPIGQMLGIPALPPKDDTVRMHSAESLLTLMNSRGDAYRVPASWMLPSVSGRSMWHVASHAPEVWRALHIQDDPFIADAGMRVVGSAAKEQSVIRAGHPVWEVLKHSEKPFVVMNDYFRPRQAYSNADYQALVEMGGDRFLGFQVHEWAYPIWKQQLEGAAQPPSTRDQAAQIVRDGYATVAALANNHMFPGEGYGLFHHVAYEQGAGMAYLEVGENIPCAPLLTAAIRGAARQFGGRPWGAYISNWFRGSVTDGRLENADSIGWRKPEDSMTRFGGHSPSLEFRLAMAAYLAGASILQHESDHYLGSVYATEYSNTSVVLSRHGAAMKRWFDFAHNDRDRGIPYTPVAFMLDANHGWRPRELIFGLWPPTRAEQSIERILFHTYSFSGRLDFESGYLTNGRYGDIFDIVTSAISTKGLEGYGVLWPLGDVPLSVTQRQSIMTYVERGGIAVLDGSIARQFTPHFTGVRLADGFLHDISIRSSIQELPPLTDPYRHRPMAIGQEAVPIAWSGQGRPVMVWKQVGQGALIISGLDHWLDVRGQMLPVTGLILQMIEKAFVPFSITGEVERILSKTRDGWIIGLINNNGIRKVPTQQETVDPAETRSCLIQFRGSAPAHFTPLMGSFSWNESAGAVEARIPPGEVAIVRFVDPGAETAVHGPPIATPAL